MGIYSNCTNKGRLKNGPSPPTYSEAGMSFQSLLQAGLVLRAFKAKQTIQIQTCYQISREKSFEGFAANESYK